MKAFVVVLGALAAVSGCDPHVVDAVLTGPRAGESAGGGASAGGAAGAGGAGGSPSQCADPARDTDQDGTADCDDACPTNPEKIEPGVCGCALPDVDRPEIASCVRQVETLVHRYRFEGSGRVAVDSRGEADGELIGDGALLDGSGALTLAGNQGENYVDFPNGLLSALESTTFEAWLTFFGGNYWERVFDFGDSSAGVEGERGRSGATYLFLTPRLYDADRPFTRAAFRSASVSEITLTATRGVPTGALTHLAVTFDAATNDFRLYLDGELADEKVPEGIVLADVNDVNNWIGRSQFAADAALSATLEEFRIYSAALTPNEVRTSFRSGPNPSFLED